LVDNSKDNIHHPWGNNVQHLTSCPATNDALQDLLQGTLDHVLEPVPVRFGDLAKALGLALQVLCDGLSQATTKSIPDLLAKGCLADFLKEDLHNLVDNIMSLNGVTALECIIIAIIFWKVGKAAEEFLLLRVSELHNIVLILWDLRDIFIIINLHWGYRIHGKFWHRSRGRSSLAFGESRVCDLDIASIDLDCRDDKGVDSDGRESKSQEGSGELHIECA
ncbi:hypothetical protein BDZ91DRAFT_814661, partial [Kalaharituber pfeilii]